MCKERNAHTNEPHGRHAFLFEITVWWLRHSAVAVTENSGAKSVLKVLLNSHTTRISLGRTRRKAMRNINVSTDARETGVEERWQWEPMVV